MGAGKQPGAMAMEIQKVVEEVHEGEITSIAYNKFRKEIYTSADGDKLIKVYRFRRGRWSGCCVVPCMCACWPAAACACMWQHKSHVDWYRLAARL